VSDSKLNGKARKSMFLGYAKDEQDHQLRCLELHSLVISENVTFDKSSASSNHGIHTYINGIQLKVELQQETFKVIGTKE